MLEGESTRDFYERRLRAEWYSVGGTTHGDRFYHKLLPGFTGDSRSCWRYLIRVLEQRAQAENPTVDFRL